MAEAYSSHDPPGFARSLELMRRPGGAAAAEIGPSAAADAEQLRRLGYGVRASGGSYEALRGTDLPLPWEVARGLGTRRVGRRVYYMGSAGSTQDEAMALLSGGGGDGSVVIAREQTAGRGRRGAAWASPPGGVWMSVALRWDPPPAAPAAASLALHGALAEAGVEARLRWPNDVVARGGKAAGISVEARSGPGGGRAAVGAGINWAVGGAELRRLVGPRPGGPPPAGLGMRGPPAPLIRGFLRRLEAAVGELDAGGAAGVAARWSAASETVGRTVSAEGPSGPVRGEALRMDPDGSLVVRCAGGDVRVSSGSASY